MFLISPALRAKLTYENIFLNWDDKDNNLFVEEDLYHASIEQIDKKLASKVLGFSTVVIIGHNPILNLLMYELTTKGHNKLPTNLFTCGCVEYILKIILKHQFLQTGKLSIIFFLECICRILNLYS